MDVEPRIARAIVGAVREKDRSGSEIWRWLGPVQGAHSELTESNLYPTLYSLEAARLLESHWREDGSIRRVYRVSGGGFDVAMRNSWPAIARRRSASAGDGATASSTTGGPGAVAEPALAEPRAAAESADRAANWPASGAESSVERDIRDYVERFESLLHVDDLRRRDIAIEIRDHLADMSGGLEATGDVDGTSAQPTDRLGPALELAAGIDAAQMTRERYRSALGWGASVAPLYFLVAYALTTCVLFATALLMEPLTLAMPPILGNTLYFPRTGEIGTAVYVLPLGIAAFLAARKSITQVALRSHRSEASLRVVWGVSGFLAVLVVALLTPVNLDLASGAGLLAFPACWAAGCLRPISLSGDLLSRRGVGLAAAVAVVVLALPGVHLWTYREGALPASAPPLASGQRVDLAWRGDLSGTELLVTPQNVPVSAWSNLRLELWPAVRSGLSIAPAAVGSPTYTTTPDQWIDLGALPGGPKDWYVLLVADGPDGSRRTLASGLTLGAPRRDHRSLAAWLLGLR